MKDNDDNIIDSSNDYDDDNDNIINNDNDNDNYENTTRLNTSVIVRAVQIL